MPTTPSRRSRPPAKTRTFGDILREMVGCGCNLPCRKWDRLGLDWCRDNAGKIAARLASEPKAELDAARARELVELAIRIAGRSAAGKPQSAGEEHANAE